MSVLPFKEDPDFTTHNSGAFAASAEDVKTFVADYEALQGQVDDAKKDQKDLFTVMKSKGYSTQALRETLKRRKQDAGERQDLEKTVQLYMDLIRR